MTWKVVDEYELSEGGCALLSGYIGTVIGLRLEDGYYNWSVRFECGDAKYYGIEELVKLIRRAHVLGVDVTH